MPTRGITLHMWLLLFNEFRLCKANFQSKVFNLLAETPQMGKNHKTKNVKTGQCADILQFLELVAEWSQGLETVTECYKFTFNDCHLSLLPKAFFSSTSSFSSPTGLQKGLSSTVYCQLEQLSISKAFFFQRYVLFCSALSNFPSH